MSERSPVSPYDPPRAGRAAWFWRTWFAYCRACPTISRLATTPLEKIATGWMLLPVVCVPLLGVYVGGSLLLRRLALPLFLLSALIAVACVGQIGGGIALGIMAAIHAMGIADYVDDRFPPWTPYRRFMRRGFLALACALLAIQLGPSAARWFVVPVGTARGVVFFNPFDRTPPFAPQAEVAFQLPRYYEGGFAIASGIFPGCVIAAPGQWVEFEPDVLTVNGIRQHPLPLMPSKGKLQVPPGHLLIWPVDLQGPTRRLIGATLNPEHFVVPDSALVGRAYKRWFWRTFTP